MAKTVRIAFLGDLHLGSQPVVLGDELKALLQRCTYVVVNLESPICKPSPIDSSKILLRSEPGMESILTDWHVTAATLANNHIFDHGIEGFEETCRVLLEQQIQFVGAGKKNSDASRPLILDCDGFRVGIIACTEPVTQARIATADAPGCNHLQFPQMTEQVRKLKAQVEVVIVAPHWGLCDYAYPPADVVSTGELLLNTGADVVIGHHSHIMQGMRRRDNGGTIVYSLGDLFFDTYQAGRQTITPAEENRKGLVVVVELAEGSVVSIAPVFTCYCGSVIHHDPRSEREKELSDRSAPLKSVECYPPCWRRAVRARLLRRIGFWAKPVHWRDIRFATIQAALTMGRQIVLRHLQKR